MNCCKHLMHNPSEQGHVLPCRDKLCFPCVQRITGLMDGKVFECPLCGNFSQYVEPERSVFGEETFTEQRGGENDHSMSQDEESDSLQADSCGNVGASESISDRSAAERRGSESTIDALMDEKGSVKFQRLRIEQTEEWNRIEKQRRLKEKPTESQAVSCASQVATFAASDVRNIPNFNKGLNTNSRIYYKDGSDSGLNTPSLNTPKKDYSVDGLCFYHNKFITFACEQCNDLLCELCKSIHALQNPNHSINRMSDLSREEGQPDTLSKHDSTATTSNVKECKHHFKPCMMYCETCKRMLCKPCLEIHAQYCILGKPVPLKRMQKELYEKFQGHLQKIDDNKRNFKEYSTAVERNLETLLGNSDKLKETVKKATEAAIQQLIENQKEMINEIDSHVQSKTTSQQKCAERANEIIASWTEIEERAQGALKIVDDSNLEEAQLSEEDVSGRITALDSKCRYYNMNTEQNMDIPLQCEVKRVAKYWARQGDRSEAPVRLNSSKPTGSWRSFDYSVFHYYLH